MSRDGFQSSLWAATATPPAHYDEMRGEIVTETVVIGGGFCGLSAALHLAEAGREVIVLEAQEPGWGASGRNGGQVNPGLKLDPSEILARYGREHGPRVLKLVDGACDLVFDLIARHGIDCAPVREGYIQGSFKPRETAVLETKVREWQAHGAPAEMLDGNAMADLLGSDRYIAGMLDRRGGSLQPLSYARGLAHAASAAGAAIHARSPATAVRREGGEWFVDVPQGRVRAGHLLIGTNGYTGGLWPRLSKTLVPVASHQSATAPLGDNLRRSILPRGHHVSEARNSMVYYRLSPDGRFMIGGRSRRPMGNEQTGDTQHLRDEAVRLFPQLEGQDWEFDWGGYVAMTPDHAPLFLQLGENAYAALAFQGRGVAMATAMGRELAGLVLGHASAMPPVRLRTIPLHGLRNLGIAWKVHSGKLMDRL